jgi:hypothetical protein
MALFGSATLLGAVLALPSGCDDTRRNPDVCHSEPCAEGFICNAQKRCVAIVPAPADASSDAARVDGGDAAAGSDASAAADAGEDSPLDGTDEGTTPDADDSSTADGSAD